MFSGPQPSRGCGLSAAAASSALARSPVVVRAVYAAAYDARLPLARAQQQLVPPAGTAASTGGAGTMSSFDLASDGGTAETVSDGDTVTISGGTALTGTVSANDTVTIKHDSFGTAGTYTYPSQIITNATGHITSVTNGSAPGTMDGFSVTGDTGTSQAIADGDTVTIAGSTGIDTVAGATGKVTVNLDLCELDAPKGDIDPAVDTLAGCFGSANGQVVIGDIKLNAFANPTANLDMNGKKIVDMADPTAAQDAARAVLASGSRRVPSAECRVPSAEC